MAVVRPRVQGIWHLQEALLEASNNNSSFEFFIALSSAASFVGNRGQAPYAAGGTFMSALAQYSPASMPFTSIDLPPVRGAGYLAKTRRNEQASAQLGIDSIDLAEIRTLIEATIRKEVQQTCQGHCVVGFNTCADKTVELQPWMEDAKFSHLRRLRLIKTESSLDDGMQNGTNMSPLAAIRQSQSVDAAQTITVSALLRKMSSILMCPIQDLYLTMPIAAYDIDSLMAMEFKSWITREFEANVSTLEILTSDSFFYPFSADSSQVCYPFSGLQEGLGPRRDGMISW